MFARSSMFHGLARVGRVVSSNNSITPNTIMLSNSSIMPSVRNAHWKAKSKKNNSKKQGPSTPQKMQIIDESVTWQGLQSGNTFTNEKPMDCDELIRTIVDRLKEKGTIVVVPGKESFAREELMKTLTTIMKYGVKPEFVLDASVKNTKLFKCLISYPDMALQIIEQFVNVGYVTFEDSIRLLGMFSDDLVKYGSDGISKNIEALSASGISTPRGIQAAILKCPLLLFARDPKDMQKMAHEIGGFFSRKQTNQLVSRCPHILLKSIEEIEDKYEYVFYQMGAESEELSECWAWIDDLSLEDLTNRHKFLVLTGKYTIPDPKRPQIKMENPRLTRIIDTSDEDFATNVARVSFEEWIVFKALQAKIEENDYKDRKFERVKPSKRKAYERRHKHREHLEEHVFDVSATA